MVLKFHYIKNKNNIFQSCEVNEKYKFISFYLLGKYKFKEV